MGLSYEQAKALGIGHLHPAASGKSERDFLLEIDPGLELPPKPSKYHAIRTEYNGITYDSKAEAARAKHLDEQTWVRWWLRQPKFRLGVPENIYIADFLVVERSHQVHVEDVKGAWTPKFKHDVKLWRKYGPCDLWVISGNKTEVVEGRIE